jgi:sulfate adenylyltransferase
MERIAANLMIIAVSSARNENVDLPTRMRCCRHVLSEFPSGRAELVLTPAISRGAGVRDELFHLLLARNFRCTHYMTNFPTNDRQFAELKAYAAELGMGILPAEQLTYSTSRNCYLPADSLSANEEVVVFGPAELQRCLDSNGNVPDWYTYPEVLAELRQAYPPRSRRGFTVFFTGLSGAGKSTLANALVARLNERGGRRVSLLDGDVVRTHLSSELGFSREHRNLNVRRIGYVASEVTKHGGIAVCAPIAPYAETRSEVRQMIEAVGGFIEVYVATPLEVCETRDRKGLYAKARAGLIKGFTGVDDPYEAPTKAEVIIDTRYASPQQAIDKIIDHLEAAGYILKTG